MSALELEIVRAPRATARPASASVASFVSQRRVNAERAAVGECERARAVAERLVADARRDAEEIRRAAEAVGRADGERRWSEAALSLAERRSEALDNLERDCVHLAIEIARQIVGATITTDGSWIESIAKRACEPLRRDASLVLRVGPAHAAHVEELRARLGANRTVDFEIDAALDAADCIAECAGVRVDARLDIQLESIRRHLLGHEDREVTA